MSRQQLLDAAPSPARQAHGHSQRAYTISQIIEIVPMSRRTFFSLRKMKALPFLEECKPRLGRIVRYRADLVDDYAAGKWRERHAPQSPAARPTVVSPQFRQPEGARS